MVDWYLTTAVSITAVIFTYIGAKMREESVIDMTIETLIRKGFIKTKQNPDGSYDILKWNENG